jgi:hypothetical protein
MANKSNKDVHVVEINGVKLEVDLRSAKVIDEYKIGDSVKVLVKEYSDSWKSYPGVIVGFDAFKNRPTIIIRYVKYKYNECTIETIYYYDGCDEIEIAAGKDWELSFNYNDAIRLLEKEIHAKILNLKEAKYKLQYFKDHFAEKIKEITNQED